MIGALRGGTELEARRGELHAAVDARIDHLLADGPRKCRERQRALARARPSSMLPTAVVSP